MKKEQFTKKIMVFFSVLVILTVIGGFSIATEHEDTTLAPTNEEASLEEKLMNEDIDNTIIENPTNGEEKSIEDANVDSASERVVGSLTRRERRIAELTDKYNDKGFGVVAYWLEVAQKYSLPICFIGITLGAFNFLIIGNKMLDKKEQGFGCIVGFTIGLVIFNVLPLIFALLVAGR